jgi:hypothetical protein
MADGSHYNSHYGEPTWGSKVLVMTFSVAVAFMAGWLVLALLLRESDAPVTMADREVPAMATKQPPRVAAPAVVSRALVAASQLLSPKADPVAPTGSVPSTPPPNVAPVTPDASVAAAPAAAAPAASTAAAPSAPATSAPAAAAPAAAMRLASLPPVPVVSPPETVPAAQPGSAVAADKVAVGDIYAPVTNKITEEDPVALPEVVPLPPHRPHFAGVPLPRPRPQIPEDTQARAEPQTLVDFLTNGWQ